MTKHILLSLTLISWLLKLWASSKKLQKSIWAEKNSFFKIALKRVLILPKARSRKMRQFPLYNIVLQNKNISVVKKHWNIEIWSQCQYILAQNIANTCRGKPIKKIINYGKYPKWFYEEKMNTVYWNCDYCRRLAFY